MLGYAQSWLEGAKEKRRVASNSHQVLWRWWYGIDLGRWWPTCISTFFMASFFACKSCLWVVYVDKSHGMKCVGLHLISQWCRIMLLRATSNVYICVDVHAWCTSDHVQISYGMVGWHDFAPTFWLSATTYVSLTSKAVVQVHTNWCA